MKNTATHIAFAMSLTLLLQLASAAQTMTPEQCMKFVSDFEPKVPGIVAATKAHIHELMPDPDAYEKTLPSKEAVLAGKQELNIRNYGGLAEAYLYNDETDKADKLLSWFAANANSVLGPTETYKAAVQGDFAIYYYGKGDMNRSTALFKASIKDYEANMAPANYNNLIADYVLMAIILKHQGKTGEAQLYAKKYVDLVLMVNKAKQ